MADPLPTIPGLPTSQQPPLSSSQSGNSTNEIPGLPSYQDMPTAGTYTTSAVPGSPEWYQQELGGLYGQPILIGITPHHTPIGKAADAAENRGALVPKAATPVTKKTEDIYQQFVSLSASNPGAFAQYQGMLYDAGFYGATPRTSIHWGQLTDADQAAMKQALTAYLSSTQAGAGGDVPLTWISNDPNHPGFLDGRAMIGRQNQAQGGVGGSGGSTTATPPPFQASLTDPATLRATVQQAAMGSLDRALSPDELEKFVSQFQAAQTAAQQSNYDNQYQVNGGGGSSVTAPDSGAEAQQFVEQEHPDEFAQHNIAAYANAFMNLFLPGGSQLANFGQPNPSISGGAQPRSADGLG